MKKSTRVVKRLLALFLVVLMSINTFAAIVSDNDGAAFITKAEFDSLKNDFQSQIDQYNVSLDSKIDGAIAAYLEGILLQKQEIRTILFPNACDAGVTSIGGSNKPAFRFGYPRMSGVTMRSDFQEKTSNQSLWPMWFSFPEKFDDYKIGKTVITNLDTNRKTAEWKGYYNECYDNLTVYSIFTNYKWSILSSWEDSWGFVKQNDNYFEDVNILNQTLTTYVDCLYDWNYTSSPGWQTNHFVLREVEQEWGGKTMEYFSVLEPWGYDMFSNYDRNYNWGYAGTYQTKFDGIENNVLLKNYWSKSTKNLGWVSKCATNISFTLDYSSGSNNNKRINNCST